MCQLCTQSYNIHNRPYPHRNSNTGEGGGEGEGGRRRGGGRERGGVEREGGDEELILLPIEGAHSNRVVNINTLVVVGHMFELLSHSCRPT